MPIKYYSEEKTFKLDTSASSYIFKIGEGGYVLGLYYGARLDECNVEHIAVRHRSGSMTPMPAEDVPYSINGTPMEYPAHGSGDFRIAALMIKDSTGSTVTDCRYKSHRIYSGKTKIPGMPSTRGGEGEAETLELVCTDVTGAEIVLVYTVYEDHPVITRRAVIRNGSDAPMWVERAYSASVDFSHPEFRLLHMWGAHARECRVERTQLGHGTTSIGSRRGASSHFHNPFAALLAPDCTEENGEAYGFSLVYSGSFSIDAEVDSFGQTRIMCGINPDGFSWKLEAGEAFYTPEAVMVYSDEGEGGMSRALHRFYRAQLIEPEWMKTPRPVIVNNWEATYFNFDTEKLVSIAKDAAELGIDMLVVDDGWFGRRDHDRCSLGDWVTNTDKLPGGLSVLAERVNALGVRLGLWFEPEMISRDSDLFREHPDWAIHTEGRGMSIARWQYVLDFSRQNVCDYIFETMAAILSSANIEYVKWDYNRNITEYSSALYPADRQGELFHRYILGLYSLLDRLKERFPHLLLEGCSGGGGRYDPAMLCYFPQYWTSDNTDAIERLSIQYGTSIAYPACSMSCHVSAVPNHQMGRITSFKTRGDVAAAGVFGYELDLNSLSEDEREQTRRQVEEYKARRHIVMYGDLYRLIRPESDVSSWMYVSEDKSEALLTFVRIKAVVSPVSFVRLRGLDPDRVYVDGEGRRYLGSTLMRAGLNLSRVRRDGESMTVYLRAE